MTHPPAVPAVPNATIQGAITASAVLVLRMARHLAHRTMSDADLQRAGVSTFLAELDRFTREVSTRGPNVATDTFTPRKGSTP